VRPTKLDLVPRIWEMLFQEVQSEVDRRTASDGAQRSEVEVQVMAEFRENLIGGRQFSAMTGSAPISPELRAWVEEFIDIHLINGYGSTEDGVVLIDDQVQRPPVLDYKLVDVPELGYFATDRPHPRGELWVKTTSVIPGYYKRPEVTAELFDADGWYHTGDQVYRKENDPRLFYVGRATDLIKAAGANVAPLEVAAVVEEFPDVAQCVVLGVAHPTRGEEVCAIVVPAADSVDVASLTTRTRAQLSSYKVPTRWIVATSAQLPTLPSGKLDRRTLAARIADGTLK
jgi:fatty acid CoA ligase FadD9